MKYNVKGYKEIKFEEHKENPLDGFVITGYINNDNTNTFSAHMWSKDDYQFEYLSSYSDKLDRMMIKNPKTVGNNKWLKMVDQNNAKEADQFNESYLRPQSVLNNLMEQDKLKTTG